MSMVAVVVVYAAAGAVLCELCERLFYERVDYKHHFKRCHLGQFSIRCEACCKGFWKTNALRQHACYPEMREENIRLQSEKEEEALRQRSDVRTSMGLGEGCGIDVFDVVESKTTETDAERLQDDSTESKAVETPLQLASDSLEIPTRLNSLRQTFHDSASRNISESTTELLPVAEHRHSNTSSDQVVDALPSHGYGTRKKKISFRQLLQCS